MQDFTVPISAFRPLNLSTPSKHPVPAPDATEARRWRSLPTCGWRSLSRCSKWHAIKVPLPPLPHAAPPGVGSGFFHSGRWGVALLCPKTKTNSKEFSSKGPYYPKTRRRIPKTNIISQTCRFFRTESEIELQHEQAAALNVVSVLGNGPPQPIPVHKWNGAECGVAMWRQCRAQKCYTICGRPVFHRPMKEPQGPLILCLHMGLANGCKW